MWGDIALWLGFAFPFWLVMLNIFTCAYWPSAFFHWKNVYSVFYTFCNWNWGGWYWVVWAIYICQKLTLYQVISFANIFSPSVGCLFILLMVSFAVQKLLSLIRSHLFIFALISFASGDGSNLIGFCFFLIYIGLYEQCFLEVNILKSLKFWSRLAS